MQYLGHTTKALYATKLEVCKKENASKDEEIARLKEFTPDMHAQEAIDSANRQLTVVLNALRATGQLLWEPKTVAQALELVQGNITVAMMKYAVNIFALDAPACKRIKVYGKATTLDFIAFSVLRSRSVCPSGASSLNRTHSLLSDVCVPGALSWRTL